MKTRSIDKNSPIQLTPDSESILNYVERSLATAEGVTPMISSIDGGNIYEEVQTTSK